jgi:hypothetical protein
MTSSASGRAVLLQAVRGSIILTLVGSLFFARSGWSANELIWQLRLQPGHPPNCTVALTRVARDSKGQLCLEADSRHDKSEWHSCIVLPQGLLKAGQDSVVTVDYEVIDRSSPDAYFYVFGRSNRLGISADHWEKWHGEPGAPDVAKLRIFPTADDYAIIAGIHNQGAMRIRSIKVLHGDGWSKNRKD